MDVDLGIYCPECGPNGEGTTVGLELKVKAGLRSEVGNLDVFPQESSCSLFPGIQRSDFLVTITNQNPLSDYRISVSF